MNDTFKNKPLRRLLVRFVLLSLLLNFTIAIGCKEHHSNSSSSSSSSTSDNQQKLNAYPLDELSRAVEPTGPLKCPKVKIISYPGQHIKYHKPVRVHPAFKELLIQFEQVVAEVATEIYGRVPDKIHHLGTYNCRRIGGNRKKLSEHSFGNGIDIASFSFTRLKQGTQLPANVPKSLKGSFKVDLLKHWNDQRTAQGLHQKFLHTLGHRLIESKIFRVLLGPSFPGHKNHFHLDRAPYDVISIF